MTTSSIRTATGSDEAPIIDVVLLAFSADPAARWTWPDPKQYLTHFPSFVRTLGGKAFAHQSAHYVDGYAGAALWLPPEVHPDEEALMTLLQSTASPQAQQDGVKLFEQMNATTRRSRTGFCRSSASIRCTRAKATVARCCNTP